MRHAKPAQLETAPTKHGGGSVYLFLEFTIIGGNSNSRLKRVTPKKYNQCNFLSEADMRSCAIFDLDGTIIDNSSERVLLRYLLEGGELPLHNLSQWLLDFIRIGDLRQAKANKVYLKGLDYQHICDLAQICFTERLVDHISPKVYDLFEFHRAEGRSIVILSGSLELLVQFFYEHLNADLMIGYSLEVVDEEITGHGAGINPYGENKAKLVEGLAEAHNFDLSESYAYGNHHSDAHKLKQVGHPVAVNPDRKLRGIAAANGWQIERFHVD